MCSILTVWNPRKLFYKCRSSTATSMPVPDLIINSNVIYDPLVLGTLLVPPILRMHSLPLGPWKLPPSDSITQIPMSAGQWKHQQKVERKRGLRIFHSGFLSTLIDLPMAEFLNWNQHLSASPLSLPQLHLPFSSSSYGPLIYECLGVFISHVGISDLVVTTVCSSFSKSSSFWQSWRQIMQYYMW